MSSVSVVIPTYNRAALLEITLRSILAQSEPPSEIIVVDDGSSDATPTVCANQPPSVKYIRQENRGLSAARNRGIRLASGNWVALCDSDDCWHPRKLEYQLAALRVAGAAWSITGCGIIGPDGERSETVGLGFERVFPVFSDSGQSADQLFRRWLESIEVSVAGATFHAYVGDAFGLLFEGNIALPSSAIVAREVISQVGPFDEQLRASEETEFFHRVAAVARVAIVMDALVDYRVGHASIISTSKAGQLIQTALESGERAARMRSPLTPAERRAFVEGKVRLLTRLAYYNLSIFDRRGARATALESWRVGGRFVPRTFAIILASLLPVAGLRLLHRAKRIRR
jgi:GT2 family glycosyltransferase